MVYRTCRDCGLQFERGDASTRQLCDSCRRLIYNWASPGRECAKCHTFFPIPKSKNGSPSGVKNCENCRVSRKREDKFLDCAKCGNRFQNARGKNGKLLRATTCIPCRTKVVKRNELGQTAVRRCAECQHLFEVERSPENKRSQRRRCFVCLPPPDAFPFGHGTADPTFSTEISAAKLPQLPELPRDDWDRRGLCFDEPDLWFDEDPVAEEVARRACLRCPVLALCRQQLLADPHMEFGVIAATIPSERKVPA